MRTRCKICGIRDSASAGWAVAAGADALGFVFAEESRRRLTPPEATRLVAALPAFVSRVGLFVNAPADQVRAVLERVPLDILQFHGEEPEDYCRAFERPYIKALRVAPGADLAALLRSYPSAALLLLDACSDSGRGGTGERFDWQLAAGASKTRPFALAGGLTPENVAEAIRLLAPFAVDVSSGVEESKGVKSRQLVNAFMHQVRLADEHRESAESEAG